MSRNVETAQKYGCRWKVGNSSCQKPVIEVENAIHCEEHFDRLLNDKYLRLGRYWCLNHNISCVSEKLGYIPLPGIQTYIPNGRPGGRYHNSGFFLMGEYCPACSLERQHKHHEDTKQAKKRKNLKRKSRDLHELEQIPTLTEATREAVKQARSTLESLEKKRKELEKDENMAIELIDIIKGHVEKNFIN